MSVGATYLPSLLREPDSAEHERQPDRVIKRKRLAEQHHREQGAEDRHKIDEETRPRRADQLDAADEEDLRQQRRL